MQLPDPQTAQVPGAGHCLLLQQKQRKELELCRLLSKKVWCPHLPSGIQDSMPVLYWVGRIWFFVDGCDSFALDFLQAQPALLSPHVPVTGFGLKTHFILER